MSAATGELVRRGLHALGRSARWWCFGIAVFALINVAFWPSLEGSDALTSLDDMGSLLEAFGAQDLTTAAGYLDGQMFALLLPLLLSGMAVAQVTSLTSGDEDAGRLELLAALPVRRSAIWLSRLAAAGIVLAAVTATAAAVVVASRPVFSLEEVSIARLVGATACCALLAAFHGAIAYAAGGLGARRGRAVATAVVVLIVGYLMSFLAPLTEALEPARRWSPWYWALGERPVSDGPEPVLLVLIVLLTVAAAAVGTIAVGRRDLRSA
jgi:ABC-2 type transport system permease protein